MKRLMSKFKVLTVFVAAFFMVLALPARSEAAAAYKIVNINSSFSDAENVKVKVGKYYFWEEEQSDGSNKVYTSKYVDGRKKSLIYQTQIGMSAGPMLTNGTYIWYMNADLKKWTGRIYRVKMNGKNRTLFLKQKAYVGQWFTLLGCRGNYIYYSVFGNGGADTVIYRVSVKRKNQTPKKVKTAQDFGGDGARYIYLTGTNNKTAIRIYDIKTKKTKSIKKTADSHVDTVKVFGGKLYYTIYVNGAYDLYQTSLSGSGRKKLITGMKMQLNEIGKVTSSAIWFKEVSNRWWKYTFATGEAFQYDGLTEYRADVQ